ncbi:MAG: DNA primase [Candidatus Thermoplasmatota archaeon]|nr:DNA primase [Candidatus Thermoplasmatota archaeon]
MYRLPRSMRYSTLEERKEFYEKEFDISSLRSWLKFRPGQTVFAMIPGRHTGIAPPEYISVKDNTILIDEYSGLEEVRDYLLQYLPEGAYYDRNVYRDIAVCAKCGKSYKNCWNCKGFLGQELAFDIDPENVKCPYHGTGEERMKIGQGLGFCMYEFKGARRKAAELYEELEKQFAQLRLVYSGRGFHIHVLDESAYKFTRNERKALAYKIAEKYPIDTWVTEGGSRLIRLPYSLHGMVSRICTPLKVSNLKDFDPRIEKMCIPKFFKN